MQQDDDIGDPQIPALPEKSDGSAMRAGKRDLSFMAGTWQEDPAFDEAIAAQDTVDEERWR